METLKAWVGYNAPAPKAGEPMKYTSEFHKSRFTFIDEHLSKIVEEFPLQALVGTVALFFFGLACIGLSLSIISGAILIAESAGLGLAIYRKGWSVWTGAWGTIQLLMSMKTTEANKVDAAKTAATTAA